MPEEKWDRAQSLFLAAADLTPGERERFLDEACSGRSWLASGSRVPDANPLDDCRVPMPLIRRRHLVGRPILAAAYLRAGFFDNQQEPPAMRLQPNWPPYNATRALTDKATSYHINYVGTWLA